VQRCAHQQHQQPGKRKGQPSPNVPATGNKAQTQSCGDSVVTA
jgi:hypothetical protein